MKKVALPDILRLISPEHIGRLREVLPILMHYTYLQSLNRDDRILYRMKRNQFGHR